MTAKEISDVFAAMAEGKQLQYYRNGWSELATHTPTALAAAIAEGREFRVKPTPREWRICTVHDGLYWNDGNVCILKRKSDPECKAVRVREVVE